MSEREALQLRYLEARARKEELAVRQLEAELAEASKKVPFFRKPAFIKPLIGGVALAILFSGYFQYIFLPLQQDLQQKLETESQVAKQKQAKHEAEAARSEFLREKLKEEVDSAKRRSELAIAQLVEAEKQNKQLQTTLASIPKGTKDSSTIEKLTKATEESAARISDQIAAAKESQIAVEGIGSALSASTSSIKGGSGWIYAGYYPNDSWNYTNLKILSGLPIVGKTYKVLNDVNVRDKAPTFSLFGYKFGHKIGNISSGEEVKVTEVTEVGFSKVWAKVELDQ